jgi:hypothetical protein
LPRGYDASAEDDYRDYVRHPAPSGGGGHGARFRQRIKLEVSTLDSAVLGLGLSGVVARCAFSTLDSAVLGLGPSGVVARCAFSDRNLHSRGVPLSFTPLFRLKLLHACDQWHFSRKFTPLTGLRCKSRPNTEGTRSSSTNTNRNPLPRTLAWLIEREEHRTLAHTWLCSNLAHQWVRSLFPYHGFFFYSAMDSAVVCLLTMDSAVACLLAIDSAVVCLRTMDSAVVCLLTMDSVTALNIC